MRANRAKALTSARLGGPQVGSIRQECGRALLARGGWTIESL